MNAMEKVAWTELLTALVATTTALALVPWMGSRATTAFALLALVAVGFYWTRKRGGRVTVDERDREIARRATAISVGAAWMVLLMAVATAGMWANYRGTYTVSTTLLNWLVWTQFALCYGLHGLVSIILYRRQPHAA